MAGVTLRRPNLRWPIPGEVTRDLPGQRIDAVRGVDPLPASEFARLRAEGVPDQVIDYMQRTYVNAIWLDGWQRGVDSALFWDWPYARRAPPYGWTGPYWGWR